MPSGSQALPGVDALLQLISGSLGPRPDPPQMGGVRASCCRGAAELPLKWSCNRLAGGVAPTFPAGFISDQEPSYQGLARRIATMTVSPRCRPGHAQLRPVERRRRQDDSPEAVLLSLAAEIRSLVLSVRSAKSCC